MVSTAPDQGASGRVEYERLADGIVEARFIGHIDYNLLQTSSDRINDFIGSGNRHFMFCIAEAIPHFSPIDVVDEFKRVFKAPSRGTKFAYVSPENLFGKHFMLIEAAAFNAGIKVAFLTTEDAARDWLMNDG